MDAAEFVRKWRAFEGKETAGYVSHFDDLCPTPGSHQTPAEADPSATFFCYQKQVAKDDGRLGFADVFFQRHFGWEYKGNHKDLEAAYFEQLLRYRGEPRKPATPRRQRLHAVR